MSFIKNVLSFPVVIFAVLFLVLAWLPCVAYDWLNSD